MMNIGPSIPTRSNNNIRHHRLIYDHSRISSISSSKVSFTSPCKNTRFKDKATRIIRWIPSLCCYITIGILRCIFAYCKIYFTALPITQTTCYNNEKTQLKFTKYLYTQRYLIDRLTTPKYKVNSTFDITIFEVMATLYVPQCIL